MTCEEIVNDFYVGDTPTWSMTVYTDITEETVVDTTGWKAWCTLKSDKDLTDANAELQVTGVMTSVNGALGLVSLKPSISQSEAIPAGTYFYDYQIKTSDNIVDTIEEGRVKVKQDITNSSTQAVN